MENTIAAIELGSKRIKLVIGYELNGKVYSIYTFNKPYGELIKENNFFDFQKLVDAVVSIKSFTDPNANVAYKITECILCLPPDGLQILGTKQRTPVMSEHKKISQNDIKNLYALIKNSCNKVNNTLVDIVPEEYLLDETKILTGNPIGEIARTLLLSAKVHMSPEHIYKNYMGVMERAGVAVKRTVVSTLAAVEYLATCQDIPQNYLLVDVGAGTSSVSLVGKNSLFGSKTFAWGGDRISNVIAEKFNISFNDAEKYKKIYGIDEREMHFNAPICTDITGENEKVSFYKEDLNNIIRYCLDEFISMLKDAINQLLERQSPECKKLPIVMIGGASQLKGLVNYMADKVENNLIKVVVPNTIGARDPTYLNCLGMILVASKYVSIHENKVRTSGLTRD